MSPGALVLLSVDQLRDELRHVVREALALGSTTPRTDLLDVAEVARELRVSQRQVRRMLALRELAVVRVGRRVFVERGELARYLGRRA